MWIWLLPVGVVEAETGISGNLGPDCSDRSRSYNTVMTLLARGCLQNTICLSR